MDITKRESTRLLCHVDVWKSREVHGVKSENANEAANTNFMHDACMALWAAIGLH